MRRDEILEVLEQLGADKVRPGGNNVQLSCLLAPWRHDSGTDRSGSMGIRINPNGPSKTHCFACRWGSETLHALVDQFAALSDRDDLDDLVERVAELEAEDPEQVVDSIPAFEDTDTADTWTTYPEVYLEPFKSEPHPYILGRGFSAETVASWEIGYDREEKRIVFPMRDRTGKLVGAIGRDVTGESRRRYHNYWEFKKGRHLYGAHKLPSEPCHVVVVEGGPDTWRVWQETRAAGREDLWPVAILGAEPTADQVRLLVSMASEVTLFLDNDGPGKKCRDDLAKRLASRVLVTGARYPADSDAKDPDALGARVVDALTNLSLLVA